MKVLLVNTYYYPNMVGGAEQSVKLLAEGLKKRGHEVFVLTGDKGNSKVEWEEINGINVIRLDLSYRSNSKLWRLTRKVFEFRNLLIVNNVNKILDIIKPDVVHTNNLFYLSTIIWKCAKKKNIKVVHTLRDYWGLCPKSTLLTKQGEICTSPKGLCSIHRKNYSLLTKYVDIVTSPSKFTLDLYLNNGIFENSKKYVVYNAIGFELAKHKILVNKRLDNNDDKIVFLFMGSLDTHKGVKFLIETFKEVKNNNIKLKICGDGPLASYIVKSCNEDERIQFFGKVYKDEKEKVLLDSDVMVVPSIWYEPFGRVVIEGYKYAMPVIGTEIGGIKELLTDATSMKVKPNDKQSLKYAIEQLSNRENIKFYLKDIGSSLAKYDVKHQISTFEEIYKS
jgi:glycosyltransferase involved in cell wall biosynthesis